MTDYILYSDGGPDSLEAHRLLVLARVDHRVYVYQDDRPQSMPKLLRPSSTQRWIGLPQVRHYLITHHHLNEPPTSLEQPPHDDNAYAKIACAASQGHSI